MRWLRGVCCVKLYADAMHAMRALTAFFNVALPALPAYSVWLETAPKAAVLSLTDWQ